MAVKRTPRPRTDEPKRCKDCDTVKPATDFYSCKSNADGLHSRCVACYKVFDQRPEMRYSRSRARARKDGVGWFIDPDWYKDTLAEPCHYCGGPNEGSGCGLDRLEPGTDYTHSNCVSTCWVCNYTKSCVFTPGEMKEVGALIAKFERLRKARGEPSFYIPYNASGQGRMRE